MIANTIGESAFGVPLEVDGFARELAGERTNSNILLDARVVLTFAGGSGGGTPAGGSGGGGGMPAEHEDATRIPNPGRTEDAKPGEKPKK